MKLPKAFYNPVSLIGTLLASITLITIFFLLLASRLFDIGGNYIGLFIFIILPVFLVIGLILIPIGLVRRSKQLKKAKAADVQPGVILDMNNKRHFNATIVFLLGTFVFLILTGIGSYEAFHYSESNEFCGTLCHKVMEPEYTAYQESSHSRVKCVECHVGEGADWFVRSKLTGLYQVYAVLTKVYPRPIPTPIESLRPARETCERCHWPQKFYSNRLVNEKHYLTDSANTEWNIVLKMKIGSEHSSMGLLEGIHWHINKNVKIEYVSDSYKRETIPWVRYINLETGDTSVYWDLYASIDETALDTLEIRTMDCMDCHNRPSHNYLPPQDYTDDLLAEGKIPIGLPDIKAQAMQVLNMEYPTRDTAKMQIEAALDEYYEMMYPDFTMENQELIAQAKEGLWEGYSRNVFHHMKVSWDKYPNHIGHIEFNGCFRCHNGDHVDDEGSQISRDCNLCHTIVGQGTNDAFQTAGINDQLEFQHPVDIGEAWKEMTCADCHSMLY